MAKTSLNLDRQADARVFSFGSTGAGTDALVTINKGTAAATTVVLDVKGSQNIGGDLNLTGNLNITGSVNTQSVTNTNVVDLTIRLNDGGSTPSDDTSGIQIEGTSNTLIGALYYKAASATKWSIGDGTSQDDIVGRTATQTLTNKSISGSQITSAVANATLADTVTTNANLTGPITSVGNATSVAAQTGTGSVFVMQNTPTLTTPVIGAATGTSLSVTGNVSVGTSSSANGEIVFRNATNSFTQSFRASNPGATITYVLPTTAPTANQLLSSTAPSGGVATLSWADASAASTVTITDDTTTNATWYPALVDSSSGTDNIKVTSTKLTFNPSTGVLSATSFTGAGTGLTGTASSLTAGTVTTNANLTGDVTSVGNATTLAAYFRQQTVTGTQDSANKTFAIGTAVKSGSELVTVNGQVLKTGSSNDYVLTGTALVFQAAFTAPAATDVIQVWGVN